jgi:dephospho-CoA kinase
MEHDGETRPVRGPKCVVGLVGGMGSGKSAVAAEFARRGARVVSGDTLGHEALRQPGIRDLVARSWGPDVLDEGGEINRRKLGAIVFRDPPQRQALEALVFPWIERGLHAAVAAAQADPQVPLVLVDAAIMLEAGWDQECDRIVYVHAPRDARLRRLAEQRGWTAKEVEARENAQMPLTDKVTRADYALDNSGPPEQLVRQVDDLWQLLLDEGK